MWACIGESDSKLLWIKRKQWGDSPGFGGFEENNVGCTWDCVVNGCFVGVEFGTKVREVAQVLLWFESDSLGLVSLRRSSTLKISSCSEEIMNVLP